MSGKGAGQQTGAHTLSRFILDEFKGEQQEIAFIMNAISVAAKIIAQAVQQAGIKPLNDFTGMTGMFRGTKHEGREYTQIDELAGDVLLNALRYSQQVGLILLDGHENPIMCPWESGAPPKKYAVVSDPLDGSTNITTNIAVGTTFGIYKSAGGAAALGDILSPGSKMICAGYVLYGAATTMLLTTGGGSGAHMFVIDPDYGEFVLTRRNVVTPDPSKQIYSINSGNSEVWDRATREFIRWTKVQETPYSARYVGSMVSDVHRTILCGGIFMYPADKRRPSGKLRLLTECFPLAMLIEEVGGLATNGLCRILDVVPKDVHEKSPVFIGCKRDIKQIEVFYAYFGTVFEESFSAPDQVAMHGGRGQPAADMHKRRKF